MVIRSGPEGYSREDGLVHYQIFLPRISINVPLLIKWHDDGTAVGGIVTDRLVSLVDLAPNALDLAGRLIP